KAQRDRASGALRNVVPALLARGLASLPACDTPRYLHQMPLQMLMAFVEHQVAGIIRRRSLEHGLFPFEKVLSTPVLYSPLWMWYVVIAPLGWVMSGSRKATPRIARRGLTIFVYIVLAPPLALLADIGRPARIGTDWRSAAAIAEGRRLALSGF